MERKRVGIILFENIEVPDFCGPFEVFSVTRRMQASGAMLANGGSTEPLDALRARAVRRVRCAS